MKKLKLSKKWFIAAVTLVVVAAAAGIAAYKWTHRWPMTFEGKITSMNSCESGDECYFTVDGKKIKRVCGLDDECLITVQGKKIMVDCGFSNWGEACPRKDNYSQVLRTAQDAWKDGKQVRVTVDKTNKKDRPLFYSLHCEKCGIEMIN